MKKILLISNMYPSNKNKHYGIFVKNVEELLRNNLLCFNEEEYGELAKNRIKNAYTWDIVVSKYKDLFKRLLDGKC